MSSVPISMSNSPNEKIKLRRDPIIPDEARVRVPALSKRNCSAGRIALGGALDGGSQAPGVSPRGAQSREKSSRLPQVRQFTTSKGSVYKIGTDGKYSRFKTAIGEHIPSMDLIVFVAPSNPYADQLLTSAAYQPGVINGRVVVLERDEKSGSAREITDIADVANPSALTLRIVGIDQSGRVFPGRDPEFRASVTAETGSVVYEVGMDARTGQSVVHVGNSVTNVMQ